MEVRGHKIIIFSAYAFLRGTMVGKERYKMMYVPYFHRDISAGRKIPSLTKWRE